MDEDESASRMVDFRKPRMEDAADIWMLIKKTGVLDLNSSYSYLLWCSYFDDTSVVIEHNNQIIGFVSAFINPKSQNVLFIWQVCVDKGFQGKQLATKMIDHLLSRKECQKVQYLEATVSPSNVPSRKLFQRLTKGLKTNMSISEFYRKDHFPESNHEEEMLYTIGPFQ